MANKNSILSCRVDAQTAMLIESSGINLSEFVRKKLDEEFGNLENIRTYKEELKQKIEKLEILEKRIINGIKQKEKQERDFLKETEQVLKRNINFLDVRLEMYNKKFAKEISKEDLLELCGLVNFN